MHIKPMALAAISLFFAASGPAHADTAILAGGCFWCVEKDMDHVKGVQSTTSGYAGGTMAKPTYENHEGYVEAVKVEFDPAVISYAALVGHFLRTIDVTDGDGQFCDRGDSYRPALFPMDDPQRKDAQEALATAGKALGSELGVRIGDNPSFVAAEGYHQDYYMGSNRVLTRFGIIKQSDAYARYRKGCGRDERVKQVWGKAAYTFPAGGNADP